MGEVPTSGPPLRSRPRKTARQRKKVPRASTDVAGPVSVSPVRPAVPGPKRSTRYTTPVRTDDALVRQRLVDFLHENIHRKLVLISAAAGYGKTALLVEFASQTDQPIAWLRLDDSDRDLVVLIKDLVGALHTRFPAYQSDVPRLAASPTTTPAELANALALEIDGALEDYFVLVLDDFHLVDSVPANSVFFNALLARLPDQAHIIMAGRTLPTLRFPQLAAKNQVAGLSEEHLRFRTNEVQALLKQRNQSEIPPAVAESLVANTEGWITGILLTTHLVWQGLVAHLIEARQSESPLFDYLATEVLDQQTEPLRQFLLEIIGHARDGAGGSGPDIGPHR